MLHDDGLYIIIPFMKGNYSFLPSFILDLYRPDLYLLPLISFFFLSFFFHLFYYYYCYIYIYIYIYSTLLSRLLMHA
jgi:hypothetical protein